MKKLSIIPLCIALSLLATSCEDQSKFEEVRFTYAQKEELIQKIISSEHNTFDIQSEINLDVENKKREINDDSTKTESTTNGSIQGDANAYIYNSNNNYNVFFNSYFNINYGELNVDDFENKIYYINDSRLYHSFVNYNNEIENLYYNSLSYDDNNNLEDTLSTIREDLINLDYVALENNKYYKITFNLKDKTYSYMYKYALIYYAQQNNKSPNEVTSLEQQIIKNYVNKLLLITKLKMTLLMNKKLEIIETLNFDISLTFTDMENTDTIGNSYYNKYLISGSISSSISYDKYKEFNLPDFQTFKESDGQEFKDTINYFIR